MTAAAPSSVSSAGLAAALMAPAAAPRGSAGFAQVLSAQQAQSAARAPAPAMAAPKPADKPTPADKPKDLEETQATQNRQAEEARARQLRANRAGSRAQGADATTPREPVVTDVDTKATDAAADPAKKADDKTDVVDPAIAEWLSRLNLPETPAPDAAATAQAGLKDLGGDALKQAADALLGEADATNDTATERPTGRRAGASSETALRQREGTGDAAAQDAGRLPDPSTESPAAWQAALDQAAVPVASTPARAAEGLKVDAASAVTAAQGLTTGQPLERTAEAPAPVVVHVPTPVETPEFPRSLGSQISVLAQDGVQHAELHLNPTDMGPISVQIVLEGDQAKVDFGADSAITRQIIENGLPELAAAMREAGFTLSGGGVHSQAQNRRDGDARSQGQGGDGRDTSGAGEPQAPARPASRARAGGIDLYA